MTVLILGSVLATSFVSGVLGMAGGMILIGVLTLLLPLASAMILHGVTQMAANGFRAYLLRGSIQWSVLPRYLLGSLLGFLIFFSFQFVPSKSFLFITIGLFPFLAIALPRSISLDVLKSQNAFICGVLIVSTQILAGASGPILDVFFIKSAMSRHQIIATKAMTQTIGHLIKVIYYSSFLLVGSEQPLNFSTLLFPGAILMAFAGTRLGKIVLDRLSEWHFRKLSRMVILLIGVVYLIKGVSMVQW